LTKINNSVIKSDYLKKLANVLDSDLGAILDELKKYDNNSPRDNSNNTITQKENNNSILRENLEKKLLILILGANKPHLLTKRIIKDYKNFITYRFESIIKTLVKVKNFKSDQFAQKLKEEIKDTYYDLYLLATEQILDRDKRKKEVAKVISQLTVLVIKEEIHAISQEMDIAEGSGNNEVVDQLESRLNQLFSQLSKLQIKKK